MLPVAPDPTNDVQDEPMDVGEVIDNSTVNGNGDEVPDPWYKVSHGYDHLEDVPRYRYKMKLAQNEDKNALIDCKLDGLKDPKYVREHQFVKIVKPQIEDKVLLLTKRTLVIPRKEFDVKELPKASVQPKRLADMPVSTINDLKTSEPRKVSLF